MSLLRNLLAAVVLCMLTATHFTMSADTSTPAPKQNIKKISLEGRVLNRLDSKDVTHAMVALLNSDSTMVAETEAIKREWTFDRNSYRQDSTAFYSLEVPKVEGHYFIRVTHPDFDTIIVPYPIQDLKKRESSRQVPKLFLTPRSHSISLNEVSVTSSKIKFYHKGDTIVYNADAFMLPEGSKLDALVAQMPGVEIRDGGQIYINGRYVEELLLNGKDFFKGKNDVMLENLGAYTVKDIAVYDKESDFSKFAGVKADNEQTYVMDVRLKKDYMSGWMGNVEGGYGTNDRYTGSLFGMYYDNHRRLSIYGGANNLNNTQRPSDGSGYSWNEPVDGELKLAMGGLDYSVEDPHKEWEVQGNVDVQQRKLDNTSETAKLNYLSGGNTYDYAFSQSVNRTLSLSTEHKMKIEKEKWNLILKPRVSYDNTRLERESESASFKQEANEITSTDIKDIYGQGGLKYRDFLINRNLSRSYSRSKVFKAKLNSEADYKLSNNNDIITFWLTAAYGRTHDSSSSSQGIDFGYRPDESMLIARKGNGSPQYRYYINGSGRYWLGLGIHNLSITYEYDLEKERKTNEQFMMEAHAQGSEAYFEPDQELLPDIANSTYSTLRTIRHIIKPAWQMSFRKDDFSLDCNIHPQFAVVNRHLDYTQGKIHVTPSATEFALQRSTAYLSLRKNNKYNLYFNYSIMTILANLIDKVDYVNDTDPLNISVGNPDLKNQLYQNIFLNFGYTLFKSGELYFYGGADINDNTISRGYRYDSATGTRIYKSYNTGKSENFYSGIGMRIQQLGAFSIYPSVNYSLNRGASMIGYDAEPTLQRLNNNHFGANIYISFKKKWIETGLSYSFGTDKGVSPMAGGNFRTTQNIPRFSVNLKPFSGLTLFTNISCQINRGYFDPTFNTDYWEWNAKASYSIPKSQWLISLSAYDILGQKQYRSMSADATGRTESLSNGLTRYFLASLAYKFDIKPKK